MACTTTACAPRRQLDRGIAPSVRRGVESLPERGLRRRRDRRGVVQEPRAGWDAPRSVGPDEAAHDEKGPCRFASSGLGLGSIGLSRQLSHRRSIVPAAAKGSPVEWSTSSAESTAGIAETAEAAVRHAIESGCRPSLAMLPSAESLEQLHPTERKALTRRMTALVLSSRLGALSNASVRAEATRTLRGRLGGELCIHTRANKECMLLWNEKYFCTMKVEGKCRTPPANVHYVAKLQECGLEYVLCSIVSLLLLHFYFCWSR